MFARVVAVEARLWTWEVLTGFDGVLDSKTLRARFAEEFPKVAEACRNGECVTEPVFREMVSFNSSAGRRHRYLVMLPEGDLSQFRSHYDRALPVSVSLYGYADSQMRTRDGFENSRFAFLEGGWLRILLFFEGRLCHWSEEPGHDTATAEERLERFDTFLERDDLFSRAKKWEKLLVDLDCEQKQERDVWFRRAIRDPFWRSLDLDEFAGIKPREKRRVGIALLVAAVFAAAVILLYRQMNCSTDGFQALVAEPPPALTPPPAFPALDSSAAFERDSFALPESVREAMRGAVPRNVRLGVHKESHTCTLPSLQLYGVVENRVFSASLEGGRRQWFSVGDSLGNFAVRSIGRDRVLFACGSEIREVRNGR